MSSRILLHCCCGPCAIYPVKSLRAKEIAVTALWWNFNIHPFQEYEKRRQTLADYCKNEGIPLIEKESYHLQDYLRAVAFRESQRCLICYQRRLEETAAIAHNGGFDYFSTTLLYSKFQQHETICELAEAAAKKFSIPFFYEDFRLGWKEGIERSKALEMYRQQYCGCIFSEYDRYQPRKKA